MRARDLDLKSGVVGLIVATAMFHAAVVIYYHLHHARHRDHHSNCTTEPVAACAGKVVLTYDNQGLNDGAGAQAQRILSLYLIAKSHERVGYLHIPIARVIYQGLDALVDNASRPGFESRWNEAFALPSFQTCGCKSAAATTTVEKKDDGCVHMYVRSLTSLEALRRMQIKSCSLRAPIVLHATFAHEITDAHPEILNESSTFHAILPWVDQAQVNNATVHRRGRSARSLNVAIHVRRGDLQFRQGQRMLPNAYYVAVARELARIFDSLQMPWELNVYTETLTQSITIAPTQVGLEPRELARPLTIAPDLSLAQDFARVAKNARMRVNGDALEALKSLATADVLVISPSSFSYVAGLLRQPGQVLVIYHPFWHAPRSDWFCVRPFGGHRISHRDIHQLRDKISREFEDTWRRRGAQRVRAPLTPMTKST